ncbi:hypothetical protein ABSA28_00738 [Candidatus Hepatincolaceae symbiont of Richtersius coronifer]
MQNEYLFKSPFIPFPSTELSIAKLKEINKKIFSGEYKLVDVPCICCPGKSAENKGDEIITGSFSPNFRNSEIKIVICKNCGMVRSNPYFNSETLLSFYTYDYKKLYSGLANYTEQHKKELASFQGGAGIFKGCSPMISSFLLRWIIKNSIKKKD